MTIYRECLSLNLLNSDLYIASYLCESGITIEMAVCSYVVS